MCVLCVVRVYVSTSDCECMCCRLSPSEPISFQAKTFLKFFPFALKTIQNYTIVNTDGVVVCFTFSAVKNGTIVVFTARQRSFGNVLFSVVSVCLFVCGGGGGSLYRAPVLHLLCTGPYPLYKVLTLTPIPDVFKLVQFGPHCTWTTTPHPTRSNYEALTVD